MGEHLNRLNEVESMEWDKAFKIFCETGLWNMGQAKRQEEERLANLVKLYDRCGPITEEELDQANGLMADSNCRRSKFPGSRDWGLESLAIKCGHKKCAANKTSFGVGKCIMPSLISIDSHGKCTGYSRKR